MARTVQKTENLFSLKVTLRGVRPPIWRRLMILGSMTLAGLHEAIQAAMGWEGSHLHTFELVAAITAIRTMLMMSSTKSSY